MSMFNGNLFVSIEVYRCLEWNPLGREPDLHPALQYYIFNRYSHVIDWNIG